MRQAVAAIGAILALAGCGDGSEAKRSELGGADWTLTIMSPEHGSTAGPEVRIVVAISGPALARGEPRSFDLGFFVDDELALRTGEPSAELLLAPGLHRVGVAGIDAAGAPLPRVLGDEIRLVTPQSP